MRIAFREGMSGFVDVTQCFPNRFSQAPHHSTQSWASFWSNNHDLPDKILAAAAGESEEEDEDEEDESEVERVVARRRPKYKESSSEADDQDDDDEEDEDAEGDEDVEEDQDEEVGNVKLPASYDESAMGQKGGSFTEADFAICARHVASFPDFREASFTEKWVPFGDKVRGYFCRGGCFSLLTAEQYPQRSAKSWAEYYRRNERGALICFSWKVSLNMLYPFIRHRKAREKYTKAGEERRTKELSITGETIMDIVNTRNGRTTQGETQICGRRRRRRGVQRP